MRQLWLVLLLAPTLAQAQAPDIELVTLTIDPFARDIAPLKETLTTQMHTRISCLLTDGVRGVPLTYSIVEAPGWANLLISPETEMLGTETCEEGWLETVATLTASASDQAPGFQPTPIVVEVRGGAAGREETARAQVALSATYFSILDVQLAEAIALVAPGGSHDFSVGFTNFGNAGTRVDMHVTEAPTWLDVSLPPTLLLQSKQAGGNAISGDMVVQVSVHDAEGFVNEVGVININITSAYDKDDRFVGDPATVSLLVTRRTGGDDARLNPVPEGALGALLAVAGVALFARRR